MILGGGIAGLWTLHRLLADGHDAVLLETGALGAGQSIQAQGIIHGGGKYALRRVEDVEAMRAIAAMPDRWRHHLDPTASPSLGPSALLSDSCDLWLPRGARWRAWLDRWGVVPLLRHAQVLHVRPQALAPGEWPQALRGPATAVYRMAEPVFATRDVMASLRETALDRILHIDPEPRPEVEADGVWRHLEVRPAGGGDAIALRAGQFVLTAGAGNEALLTVAGASVPRMQRRPLRMLLLRGPLPPLFGHCILGGKTRLTVTASAPVEGERVWQLGGEIAESLAGTTDDALALARMRGELARCLPGLPLSGCRWASYAAVRAEAATTDARRPSGVDVHRVASNVVVGWPTKWALAPLLAEEVAAECAAPIPDPAASAAWRAGWPHPNVAPYPWENAAWSLVA